VEDAGSFRRSTHSRTAKGEGACASQVSD
jgi:hypothetical protein